MTLHKKNSYHKSVRASGKFPITLVDTDLNIILLEKSRSLAVPGPNQYSIQNPFYNPGRICACGTRKREKRLSPLDFISFCPSSGTDWR